MAGDTEVIGVVDEEIEVVGVVEGVGPPGAKGDPGVDGADGDAATVAVGTVTTGAPGDPAVVSNVGTTSDAVLNFTIPEGVAGTNGTGWTGASYNPTDGTITFTSTDGLGFQTGDLRGTDGDPGADGSVWRAGAGAPSDTLGVDGDYYLNTTNSDVYLRATGTYSVVANIGGTDGTNGTDGLGWTSGAYDSGTGVVTFASTDGLGFSTGDLRGAPGLDGADGATWHSGAGVPANGLGADGDYYLDTATSDVYLKATGTYSVVANIGGAPGSNGTDGDSAYEVAVAGGFVGSEAAWLASLVGPEGPTGPTGATGPAGADGTNGADGADGLGWTGGSYAAGTGVVTFTSTDGLGFATGDLRGATGATGATGPAGADGADGVGVPVGGTTGQVLAKATATDYDTEWVDPPVGGGGTAVIQETTLTDANGDGVVALAEAFTIHRVDFAAAGRLRLYRTTAGRTADAARAFTTPYTGGAGLLYDYEATAAESDLEEPSNGAWAAGETTIYYAVVGPVTITLTWAQTGASA